MRGRIAGRDRETQRKQQRYCKPRQRECDHKTGSNASLQTKGANHRAADERGDHHRNALKHRLNRETHRAAFLRQRISNRREDGGRSHRLPRHDEGQPQKEVGPGRTRKINEVARDRGRQKGQEGSPPAPMIREPAAWVLVDGIEEIFRCAEQSYSRDRRSKRFEIFGKKLLPEFLSQPRQKHGSRSGSNVPFDPQRVCNCFLDASPRTRY